MCCGVLRTLLRVEDGLLEIRLRLPVHGALLGQLLLHRHLGPLRLTAQQAVGLREMMNSTFNRLSKLLLAELVEQVWVEI